MSKRLTAAVAALGFLLVSVPASAQVITTVPAAAPVPAMPPWALLILGLGLMAVAFRALRGRGGRHATASLLALALAAALLSYGPAVWAAIASTFTNPAGETLAIPVTQIPSGPDLAGWELADFTNSSGAALKVDAIALPAYADCLPGGLSGALLPAGAPPPSPPQTCAVGLILNDGDTCRVDVDTTCRALVTPHLAALTSITASSGTASGGVGVTLTGTNLTGTTGVTLGGVAATSVNVVSSTSVTAVTPAHAVGAVDVVISTPQGSATLTNGFTYLATAVGQPSGGGIIAALGGGLNNLIAATADNRYRASSGVGSARRWAGAQSDTDGASNTTAIVAALGANGGTPYGAQLCSAYEVDSQGNTPCQAGNACYNNWFLPPRSDCS